MKLNKIFAIAVFAGLMPAVSMADSTAEATAAAKAAQDAASSAAESAASAAKSASDAAASAASMGAGAGADTASDEPKYVVVDGKVDKPTFNGYRRFHGTCHACHGQDAAGGSFAPSLVESLKTMNYADFTKTVMEGRQAASSGGGTSAMPAFANDPNITKHLDDIYVYVKARSDGAIGAGRPAKMPKPK